ncbi:hypothetical protein GCM10023340_08100 [Nocardioides marinquilinus]|uniref:Uncharacterized protein n=1 Tax=Nocardioides marinquilinus TaxID=1210400 RepID=A0ABP9PBT7_9ACTN
MSTTSWPPGLVPLHVGADHPALLALTLVLAFGPFVLLGVVMWRRRRLEEHDGTPAEASGDGTTDDADDAAQRER